MDNSRESRSRGISASTRILYIWGLLGEGKRTGGGWKTRTTMGYDGLFFWLSLSCSLSLPLSRTGTNDLANGRKPLGVVKRSIERRYGRMCTGEWSSRRNRGVRDERAALPRVYLSCPFVSLARGRTKRKTLCSSIQTIEYSLSLSLPPCSGRSIHSSVASFFFRITFFFHRHSWHFSLLLRARCPPRSFLLISIEYCKPVCITCIRARKPLSLRCQDAALVL